MHIVRRKTCPDISCPRLSRGIACQLESGNDKSVENRLGCVDGDRGDLAKQYACGTEMTPPVGKASMHSPPESAMTRSSTAGPKNQLVNTSQIAVSASHLYMRSMACASGGLVRYRNRNPADVQPHAFLINTTFKRLDLLAK